VYLVDRQKHEVENHQGNPAIYTWPSPRPIHVRDALFLRRLILKYRPDCMVSAFGSTNVMLMVGWWMGVPCRATWYLTLQEAIEIDGHLSRWKIKLLHYRKRFVYSLASHVLPNSAAGMTDVQENFGIPAEKCNVLYLSLPDPKSQILDLTTTVEANRTICVGRLDRTKGQDVLLNAISKLKDRFPNTVFEFVGEGPIRAECERLAEELGISDRCRFVGRLPHNEVLQRMAESAVSVVPSRSECFGLVNIESLATGTPLVASDVGGIGEIFDDGEQGYLVPPDNPELLADRIAALLADPVLRGEMSHKALQRFEEFEQNRVIGRQVDWLESLPPDSNAQRQELKVP
jgi:glycosyltransferase involved in cell wall biosynthesis